MKCKHVLIPGEAHCLACGEQILYTGFGRTHWQRFIALISGWWQFLLSDNNAGTTKESSLP